MRSQLRVIGRDSEQRLDLSPASDIIIASARIWRNYAFLRANIFATTPVRARRQNNSLGFIGLTCAALPQPAPPPFAAINAAVAQYFFKTTALGPVEIHRELMSAAARRIMALKL